MPTASDMTAVRVNSGVLRRSRRAKRASCTQVSSIDYLHIYERLRMLRRLAARGSASRGLDVAFSDVEEVTHSMAEDDDLDLAGDMDDEDSGDEDAGMEGEMTESGRSGGGGSRKSGGGSRRSTGGGSRKSTGGGSRKS